MPPQLGIVRKPLVDSEVPILRVSKSSHMAIKEEELGAPLVQVRMDEGPSADGRKILGIEQPDHICRPPDAGNAGGHITAAGSIDKFIEAIMKEIVAIAAPPVGWTNPHGIAHVSAAIGPPRHVVIPRNAQLQWQLDIPAAVRVHGQRIGESFGRQEIVMIGGIQLCGQTPLLQIVHAGDAAGRSFRPAENRQEKRRQHRDDGYYDEQFNQRESVPLSPKECHLVNSS